MRRRRLESDADRCCGRDRRHSGGFLLRIMPPSWHPVPACAPRLRCRRAVLLAGNGLTQAELFYLRQRKLESDADRCCGRGRCHSGGFLLRIMPPSWHPVPACAPRLFCRRAILFAGNGLTQAGRSTCRHDSAASILDFKPRHANQCSQKVKTGAIRASILDFRPRLANRCSQKVKTGAILASILDFKPRLANRCSQKVKTGVIRAAIPDFRLKLANRCSQKAKTGAIHASILDLKPRLANRCSQKVKSGAIRASILDFRPRLANRCSQKAKTGAIHASILDLKPRLANRCSHKVKTGAIHASILDFKPRLANRCSQKVKTGAIPAAQGRSALCRGRGMPDGQGLRTA